MWCVISGDPGDVLPLSIGGRIDTAAALLHANGDKNLAVKLASYIGLYYHKEAVKLVLHLITPPHPEGKKKEASLAVNSTADMV